MKRQPLVYFQVIISYSFFSTFASLLLGVPSFILTLNHLSFCNYSRLFFSSTSTDSYFMFATFHGYCLSTHLLLSSLLFVWAQHNWFLFVNFAFSFYNPASLILSSNRPILHQPILLLFFHLLLFLLSTFASSPWPSLSICHQWFFPFIFAPIIFLLLSYKWLTFNVSVPSLSPYIYIVISISFFFLQPPLLTLISIYWGSLHADNIRT